MSVSCYNFFEDLKFSEIQKYTEVYIMVPNEEMVWDAKWIWNDGEESPRNEWWCFRKTFFVQENNVQESELRITGDSRYVLFINGEQVGRGPVRSWPFEQSYDTYSIKRWLKPGKNNTIAVLILHFGVSNFYYLRGRGGLLAQLDITYDNSQTEKIVTDHSWKAARFNGQDSRSPRMSCQQGYAEQIDARVWDANWKLPFYQDDSWQNATVIGSVGMEPWTNVVPRDIPFLTEEPVQPVRVEQMSKVRPISFSAAIDIRNHMMPESVNHANPVGYVGYIATVIRLSSPAKLTLGFPVGSFNFGSCRIGESVYNLDEFYGVQPERYLDVELPAGDHFFMMDVTGTDHGTGFHMGIDCESSFELISPVQQAIGDSQFITIGPFDVMEYIDHQRTRSIQLDSSDYKESGNISSVEELKKFSQWIRPIPKTLVSQHDVFTTCVWKKEERASIPASFQNIVTPSVDTTIVPIFKNLDTEFILDFGKEQSGYITFAVDASEGTILDFYGFEYIWEGWRQDTFGLDNTIRYVCREGFQEYTSPIRRGFRYLMVTVRNATRPVEVNTIHMIQSNYPVAEVGRFQSSDAKLNKIWEISKHTTRLCMEDTFVDCPSYEQVFWVGDSRNEALVNYYVFGASEIVKRCLNLVTGSKFQTPLFADQVPSGWSSVIPNWTFFWAIACQEYYQTTGDTEFLKGIWPEIEFTLKHYLEKLNEKGLLYIKGWNLLDWAPIDQPNDGIVTHQNLFLLKTLSVSSQIAEQMGEHQKSEFYFREAENLKSAINEHLWSNEKQAYLDCIHTDGRESTIFSMQSQVCAYLCGVADGERRTILERYLNHPPEDFVQIGSPFMSFFYYEALTMLGDTRTLLNDIRQNYGVMVDYDATTCWEMYPNFSENRPNPNMLTRSHCHAWSAAPAYFLGAYVLGVQGAAPGWTKVVVEPHPGDLSWARGTVPLTNSGSISVNWKVTNGQKMHVEVYAPKDIEVLVKLPEGYEGSMKLIQI